MIKECNQCGSDKLKTRILDTISNIICESELYCVECGKILNYFSYGHWDIDMGNSNLIKAGEYERAKIIENKKNEIC